MPCRNRPWGIYKEANFLLCARMDPECRSMTRHLSRMFTKRLSNYRSADSVLRTSTIPKVVILLRKAPSGQACFSLARSDPNGNGSLILAGKPLPTKYFVDVRGTRWEQRGVDCRDAIAAQKDLHMRFSA